MTKQETIPGKADITLNDNGILELCMHKTSIDLDDAKKITELIHSMPGDIVHANLVDIRNMAFMSGDARKLFGSQDKKTVKAVAIIINSKLHRPITNLYLKFSRPALPTKMFDDKEEAQSWLLSKLQ